MFAKLMAVLFVSAVAWVGFAHPSEATAPARTYVVEPGDSLWSIAARHYAGDPREGVWRVKAANDLEEVMLSPGQRLTLP